MARRSRRPTRTGSGPRGCATSSTASRPDGRRSPGPSTPTTRSRSCSPRRRPAATASRARSRAAFPIPSTTRSGSRSRRTGTPTTAGATMGYRPSPRPSFDAPTVIRARTRSSATPGATRRRASSRTGSTSRPSSSTRSSSACRRVGAFRHSESFRTVFAADELLHVLQGTLVLANPETGEVVRAEPGESVFFRRDTWHHGFSYGDEPLRVLEFFAPPPATGTSGAYALTQPVPRAEHLRRRRGRSASSSEATPRPARCSVLRRADAVLAARPRRPRRPPRQHRAPHGRHADRPRRAERASSRRTTARSSCTPPAARCASRRAGSRRPSRPATASSSRRVRRTATRRPAEARGGDLRRGAELRAADGRLITHSGRQPPCGKAVLGFGWPRMRVQQRRPILRATPTMGGRG